MREIGDPAQIAWVTGPVRKTLPNVPICRAKPHKRLTYTLLSGVWHAIRVHNVERRDTPCLGENCPHFFAGYHRSTLLKWYTDGYAWLSQQVCLVEVTEGAMKPYLDTEGRLIPFRRGQTVELSRAGDKEHSRGVLLILPAETNPDQLPPPIDVRGALLNNWLGDTKKV